MRGLVYTELELLLSPPPALGGENGLAFCLSVFLLFLSSPLSLCVIADLKREREINREEEKRKKKGV